MKVQKKKHSCTISHKHFYKSNCVIFLELLNFNLWHVFSSVMTLCCGSLKTFLLPPKWSWSSPFSKSMLSEDFAFYLFTSTSSLHHQKAKRVLQLESSTQCHDQKPCFVPHSEQLFQEGAMRLLRIIVRCQLSLALNSSKQQGCCLIKRIYLLLKLEIVN